MPYPTQGVSTGGPSMADPRGRSATKVRDLSFFARPLSRFGAKRYQPAAVRRPTPITTSDTFATVAFVSTLSLFSLSVLHAVAKSFCTDGFGLLQTPCVLRPRAFAAVRI